VGEAAVAATMTAMAGPPRPLAYLDHAATTPLRPEARAAMLPWLGERFGNPSGAHAVARAARTAIDEARDTVAAALGCAPNEVVYTSGGTEADNLAIRGVVAARPGPVIISAVEHHAVLHPSEHVGGHTVGVDACGLVDLDALAAALEEHPDTTLVSVMAANNEVGVVQPLEGVARVVRKLAPDAAIHTDAVQAAAWLDVADLAGRADLVSISAHKFGGPQGVGALVVRRGTPIRARVLGGGQERELRSGTHNVAGIVGLAAALAAKTAQRATEANRVAALRDRLATGLLAAIPDARETAAPDGDRRHLLPGTLHLTIADVESEALLFLLDEAGVCASAASACASGAQEASHVLAAMGASSDATAGALRLSLGWSSTDADVDRVLGVLPDAVSRLRAATGGRTTVGTTR
jgi:cysteine desulfurase